MRAGLQDFDESMSSFLFVDGETGTGATVTHRYDDEGVYAVTLTVSDGTTDSTLTKNAFIQVSREVCRIPDFANVWRFAQGGQPGAQEVASV